MIVEVFYKETGKYINEHRWRATVNDISEFYNIK